jgi:hypothetical protein
MASKKPRNPITSYRNRNMREQGSQGRRNSATSNSNQTVAKVFVIVFIIIMLIVFYVLGFFSA